MLPLHHTAHIHLLSTQEDGETWLRYLAFQPIVRYPVDNAGFEPALQVCHTCVLPLTLIARGVRRDSNPHKPRPQRGAFAVMLRTQRKRWDSNPQGFSGPSRFLDGVPLPCGSASKRGHHGDRTRPKLLCRQPLTSSKLDGQSGGHGTRTHTGFHTLSWLATSPLSNSLILHCHLHSIKGRAPYG